MNIALERAIGIVAIFLFSVFRVWVWLGAVRVRFGKRRKWWFI